MKCRLQQLFWFIIMMSIAGIVWAGPYSGAFVDPNHPEGTIDEGIPGFVGPAGVGVTYHEHSDGSSNCNFVNPIFKQWASEIINYAPAPDVDDDWNKSEQALGPVTGNNFHIVSLGDLNVEQINANISPGKICMRFDYPIVNKPGHDLVIFENGFSSGAMNTITGELAYVEVSSDGTQFARFPSAYSAASDLVGVYGIIDPTWVYNLAGKHANAYGQSWGTPFDLSSLENEPLVKAGQVNLNHILFINIVDIPGNGHYKDMNGQSIYDGWPTQGSGGFDLEAVGVIHSQSGADFENLDLGPDSYWAGQSEVQYQTKKQRQMDMRALYRKNLRADPVLTEFTSGGMTFPNYLTDWGTMTSWDGFAYANMKDTETPGLDNQYSAFTGIGVNQSSNYCIAYLPSSKRITFDSLMPVSGLYVTNTTYAMLSMQNGDGHAKKFGGNHGDDPDFFKLIIKGIKANNEYTDPIAYYLADFRFEDNHHDYIVDQWQWLDLSHMGELSGLEFSMDSSDKGDYGLNTPAYVALDNINGTPPYSARIMGYVKSNIHNYENPIHSATVYLKGTSQKIKTDATGHFCFENIPVGNYTIEVTANYFDTIMTDIHTDVSTLIRMNPVCAIDFEDLDLAPDTAWNGAAQTRNNPTTIQQMIKRRTEIKNSVETTFQSGYAHFQNTWSEQSWSGFAYSNKTDTETPGWENQFSAITGKGVHGSPNYAVAYITTDWQGGTNDPIPREISFDTDNGIILNGMYVTNTTYAYLEMKNGGYAKKFGGASGDDPDFFKLIVTGYDMNDNETGELEFYLADFRFDDNSQDYIIDDWQWVDLSSLGPVKKLKCSMDSSDKGNFGINTPMYFAIDNIDQITLGSVKGVVTTDITGQSANIMNAVVSIVGTDITTRTDELGRFQIDNIITGNYKLEISSDRFNPVTVDFMVLHEEYTEIPQDMSRLHEPVTHCAWDINQNGKIDLAEIIHYLKILSTMEQ